MSEYIKREYLDDAIKENRFAALVNGNVYTVVQVDAINAIPAEPVEPVVRCKDCVAYAGKERKGGGIMMICRLNKHEASPEHFCSQGMNRAHMERSGSGE